METIHLKTVDPVSQELLRSAARDGIRLNWERYERQQPLDGFQRLGLSCPYGCMQGPCRIDPFGRGPDRGLCGLNRDGMVAAFLLRLSLHGILEALNDGIAGKVTPMKQFPSPLNGMFGRALKHLGGYPLDLHEVERSALLLNRPAESPEGLIQQALRLGILALVLSKRGKSPGKPSRSLRCRVGYGLLSENKVFIGVAGQPFPKSISSLQKEASRRGSPPVQLISLGSWIRTDDGILPFACTSGEAELLLSSGKIDLLLAGPRTDPSLLELCQTLEIPVRMTQETAKAGEILQLARQHHSTRSQKKTLFDSSLVGEGRVMADIPGLKTLLKKSSSTKVAIIAGSDTPQQSIGWLPVELTKALLAEDYLVAGWGDSALWMVKNGLALQPDSAIALLDQNQNPWLAVEALATARRIKDLQGICLTGPKACQDLSSALGLASLGIKVCVATPLPLWGSEKVRSLLEERMAAVGGELTHFDRPATPQEILEWFTG